MVGRKGLGLWERIEKVKYGFMELGGKRYGDDGERGSDLNCNI